MRKLVSGLFMTMDGVVEAPNTWQFDAFDGDMMAALEAHLATEDTILLGRVTYQEWAPYWPASTDEPYASHINTVPKFVVSKTLDAVPWGKWNNARVIKANLKEEINRLKQTPAIVLGMDLLTQFDSVALDFGLRALVVDPAARINEHRIRVRGAFGELEIVLRNNPLATNPKSSELTALSLVRLIEQQGRTVVI